MKVDKEIILKRKRKKKKKKKRKIKRGKKKNKELLVSEVIVRVSY